MKKVIIIGGGVTGLTAGIYLKINGYDVEILEKNYVVGGACIGWERKGSYIDGCIHWMVGTNPKDPLNKLWKDVHAIENDTQIFYQNDIHKHLFDDGSSLTFWTDLEKTQKELISFAPEDEKEIKRFIKMIKRFAKINPPCFKPVDLMNLGDLLKIGFTMAGDYYWVSKTSKLSCEDYSRRFRNERLRSIIKHFMAEGYNLMSMLYMLGHMCALDGGIPVGGSLDMALRMEKAYVAYGGKIRKSVEVEQIVVENSTAKGVILKNGEKIFADWVVATTPIEHTLYDLLGGKYYVKDFDSRLHDEKNYPIYTYYGVVIRCPSTIANKTLSTNIVTDKPLSMDKPYERIAFRNYGYDKTLKANGDSIIIQAHVLGDDDTYKWWKARKEDGTYKSKKIEFAQDILTLAKKLYPDVANEMEIIDVFTPCTYERYLNSRHGSFQGFIHTSKGKSLMHNGRIKGLKNFLLAGQWLIRSGGLPPAVMCGRFSAQRICHDDKKKFIEPQS